MPMSDTSQLLARDTFFANAAAASKTYAPVATAPKEVVIERLPLTRLPSAMRNMGWDTAAALMQRWFDSPAWQMPDSWKDSKGGGAAPPPATLLPSSRVDDTTVRMDCALRFVRCQKAVAEARDKTTPANKISFPRSTGQLIIRLRDMGWDGVKPCTFGTTKLTARQLEQYCQINFASLGTKLKDTIDDMFGALGVASVKVAVVGEAKRSSEGKCEFHVSHRGFYIRDHYDFNGSQPLGI